jgi:RNA polymerase sigma-70 factor (ECF subfamily)
VSDGAGQIYERLLVLRCQGGDESALRELIERYSPGLRLFLAKIGDRRSSADDLLQETWFDAYRKINRLENPNAFVAWLYRVARDKAFREMRRRPIPTPVSDERCTEQMAGPEEEFTAEEAEQVRLALDELPIDQREMLILRFVESMSYQQIAQVIGCPLGTVRSRLFYAKQALRTKLEPNFD